MEVVDEYAARNESDGKRKGMVMASYVLLAGVNDSDECAHQLCDLVKGRPVIVNLIPYNPFDENLYRYETPSCERVDAFLGVLAEADIRVFQRRHHGRDIGAACGRLAKLGSQPPARDIENCNTCSGGEAPEQKAVAQGPAASLWPPRFRDSALEHLSRPVAASLLVVAGLAATVVAIGWARSRSSR